VLQQVAAVEASSSAWAAYAPNGFCGWTAYRCQSLRTSTVATAHAVLLLPPDHPSAGRGDLGAALQGSSVGLSCNVHDERRPGWLG